MLLHAEKKSLFGLRLLRAFFGCLQVAGGLGRRGEVAFLFVFLENHESASSFQLFYGSRIPDRGTFHSINIQHCQFTLPIILLIHGVSANMTSAETTENAATAPNSVGSANDSYSPETRPPM